MGRHPVHGRHARVTPAAHLAAPLRGGARRGRPGRGPGSDVHRAPRQAVRAREILRRRRRAGPPAAHTAPAAGGSTIGCRRCTAAAFWVGCSRSSRRSTVSGDRATSTTGTRWTSTPFADHPQRGASLYAADPQPQAVRAPCWQGNGRAGTAGPGADVPRCRQVDEQEPLRRRASGWRTDAMRRLKPAENGRRQMVEFLIRHHLQHVRGPRSGATPRNPDTVDRAVHAAGRNRGAAEAADCLLTLADVDAVESRAC